MVASGRSVRRYVRQRPPPLARYAIECVSIFVRCKLSSCRNCSAAGARSLLESPVVKHEGIVPWWRYRDPKNCWNVERWWPDDVDDGEWPERDQCQLTVSTGVGATGVVFSTVSLLNI